MRQTTLFTFFAAVLMAIALFYLKYEVNSLQDELAELNGGIARDKEAVHVLRAEWSYLNETGRLRELAGRYLDLEPTKPEQIATPADIAERLPVPSAFSPDGDIAAGAHRARADANQADINRGGKQ